MKIRNISAILFIFSICGFTQELNLSEEADKILELIFDSKYSEAEPLVRNCLRAVPEEIYFLSQLDIVLNGQGKYEEAQKVHDQILDIWEKNEKKKWIDEGKPKATASWARMVVESKSYHLIGAEYYEPEILGNEPPQITTFFKIIAKPKNKEQKARLFKLEMSNILEEFYVLRESLPDGGGAQRIKFGNKKPSLQKLVDETKHYLDESP